MRIKVLSATLLLMTSMQIQSADKEGRFAVKGAGVTNCKSYHQEWQADSKVFFAYAGWMEGYLTATNQYLTETYDIVPWQNTKLLAALVANHCEKHPDLPFLTAVRSMVQSLQPSRLQESSVLVMAQSETKGIRIYREVLRQLQQRLQELKLYQGEIDGIYGDGTRAAVTEFQKSKNIEVNGLPDQATLLTLLQ
ncbi:MAG: peptidoglycan-binding protein [Chromatiaceae bacterium]|nr:peptidoglycan-binding protein [Chromatiaceae bacterium]